MASLESPLVFPFQAVWMGILQRVCVSCWGMSAADRFLFKLLVQDIWKATKGLSTDVGSMHTHSRQSDAPLTQSRPCICPHSRLKDGLK